MIGARIVTVLMRTRLIADVNMVRRTVIMVVRGHRLMMRASGVAGDDRKRSSQRLQRQQQEHEHRELFLPAFHERGESIQKPGALQ